MRPPRGAVFLLGGSRTLRTAAREATAHQRRTGAGRWPRGGDGLHRTPPAVTARAVAGETASCERRLTRLELYAGKPARTVLRGREVSNGLLPPDRRR